MKTQLFLTSSVHAVAHDIARRVDIARANKLVFIDTAAEPDTGDKEWLKNDREALVQAGFAVADYTITGKTQEELMRDLDSFDYIYLSGGNTAYLLEQSQKSSFIPVIQDLVLRKGKIYIGTSAGSIIAGPKLPDYFSEEGAERLKDKSAFGLVNFTIMPHWGSEDFREAYLGELNIAYKKDQVPLLLLTDTQYAHLKDGRIDIVDVQSAK